MTFKQLVKTNCWESISSIFLKIYPQASENIEGYKMVFEKLIVIEAERIDISIVVTKVKDQEEEYFDVSGLHNNPKNEEEKYSQGIEFVPWRKWLGMDISRESLIDFSPQEIIVHCLYEMTFVSFKEEDIHKKLKK